MVAGDDVRGSKVNSRRLLAHPIVFYLMVAICYHRLSLSFIKESNMRYMPLKSIPVRSPILQDLEIQGTIFVLSDQCMMRQRAVLVDK